MTKCKCTDGYCRKNTDNRYCSKMGFDLKRQPTSLDLWLQNTCITLYKDCENILVTFYMWDKDKVLGTFVCHRLTNTSEVSTQML